jgi:acid-sensing ion channel, other
LKSSAQQDGLTLFLKSNQNIKMFDLCKFWAFTVHSPFELPGSYEDDTETCELHFGVDVDVLITPEIIYTDKALRSYEPEKRGCYFEGEKKLKFFKVYTRRNCEVECFAQYNYTDGRDNEIDCVPYYMPRNNESQICDHRFEFFVQFTNFFFQSDLYGDLSDCKCLEACDSINYKIEVFDKKRADFDNSFDIHNFGNDFAKETNVTINFKLKDDDVIPMFRYQPLTFVEFLAQSGGLMGLFAGISALSVIETFYFFTLRLICNFVRFGFVKKN